MNQINYNNISPSGLKHEGHKKYKGTLPFNEKSSYELTNFENDYEIFEPINLFYLNVYLGIC